MSKNRSIRFVDTEKEGAELTFDLGTEATKDEIKEAERFLEEIETE